jgi:hypothetical protein
MTAANGRDQAAQEIVGPIDDGQSRSLFGQSSASNEMGRGLQAERSAVIVLFVDDISPIIVLIEGQSSDKHRV